jgi:hypothetical protein
MARAFAALRLATGKSVAAAHTLQAMCALPNYPSCSDRRGH